MRGSFRKIEESTVRMVAGTLLYNLSLEKRPRQNLEHCEGVKDVNFKSLIACFLAPTVDLARHSTGVH